MAPRETQCRVESCGVEHIYQALVPPRAAATRGAWGGATTPTEERFFAARCSPLVRSRLCLPRALASGADANPPPCAARAQFPPANWNVQTTACPASVCATPASALSAGLSSWASRRSPRGLGAADSPRRPRARRGKSRTASTARTTSRTSSTRRTTRSTRTTLAACRPAARATSRRGRRPARMFTTST